MQFVVFVAIRIFVPIRILVYHFNYAISYFMRGVGDAVVAVVSEKLSETVFKFVRRQISFAGDVFAHAKNHVGKKYLFRYGQG